MISYKDIYDKIALANNGKLMLKNFSIKERVVVDIMIDQCLLSPARFMVYGDAVKVSYSNPLYKG
jgi:hypothetical protein